MSGSAYPCASQLSDMARMASHFDVDLVVIENVADLLRFKDVL